MTPAPARDQLPPVLRRAAVGAIVALHGAAAWGLLQVEAVRSVVAEAAPLFVDLIAPPAPERPPEPPPPAAPPPPRKLPPAPVIAAAPAPQPVPFVVPEPPPEAAPPAPQEPPAVAAEAPAPSAPSAPPPPPAPARELPASAIEYLDPPAPTYPRASRRLGEAGLVVVRVFVGSDGQPRQLQVLHSSGYARLDEAALEGVRRARFKPPTESGRPTAGWARIPIPFELEK